MFEWDAAKRQANLVKHGVDFADIVSFDWLTAEVEVDHRSDYSELREGAYGLIGLRLYLAVYTKRGDRTRLISLRKANEREQRKWVNKRKLG